MGWQLKHNLCIQEKSSRHHLQPNSFNEHKQAFPHAHTLQYDSYSLRLQVQTECEQTFGASQQHLQLSHNHT
jgi:hypothetical protein